MNKPYILTLDDDPIVLKSVERDLQQRYAADYRIISINIGTAALDYLLRIQSTEDLVALMLVDQRMPQMTGIDFLSRAHLLFPAAKKVLLTAYADTEAAIDAINKVRLDYYLMKPWDPPEENLFPILDDLLIEWRVGMFPPGMRSNDS